VNCIAVVRHSYPAVSADRCICGPLLAALDGALDEFAIHPLKLLARPQAIALVAGLGLSHAVPVRWQSAHDPRNNN
jgi:hypothetical protein